MTKFSLDISNLIKYDISDSAKRRFLMLRTNERMKINRTPTETSYALSN